MTQKNLLSCHLTWYVSSSPPRNICNANINIQIVYQKYCLFFVCEWLTSNPKDTDLSILTLAWKSNFFGLFRTFVGNHFNAFLIELGVSEIEVVYGLVCLPSVRIACWVGNVYFLWVDVVCISFIFCQLLSQQYNWF